MYLDECWALVETAERTGRHCMQLENCCYGEVEMLTLNLVRQGKLGELVHGEGAYIHDLRELNYLDPKKGGYQGYWRLKWNRDHYGNPYPTHGLVPLMQAMNVNRGDRFDYLTCVSTDQVGMDSYAKISFGEDSWQAKLHPRCGDMSTTVIRTVKGKTIMVQHDVTSARPYSRINLLSGTMGCLNDYPFRIALADKPGAGAHEWFDKAKTDAARIPVIQSGLEGASAKIASDMAILGTDKMREIADALGKVAEGADAADEHVSEAERKKDEEKEIAFDPLNAIREALDKIDAAILQAIEENQMLKA
jgi:hypothetical protein